MRQIVKRNDKGNCIAHDNSGNIVADEMDNYLSYKIENIQYVPGVQW